MDFMARRKMKVSIAITPEMLARVDRMAVAQKRSRSELIETLIGDGIGEEELFVKVAHQPALVESLMRVFAEPGVLRQIASVMNEDMSDEQLQLFRQAMESLPGKMQSAKPAPLLRSRKGRRLAVRR